LKSSKQSEFIGQGRALICLLVVLEWVGPALGQERPPLTLTQIEQLISARTPDEVVAGEVAARGVGFIPTASIVSVLRQKGAGPRTLFSLERPKPRVICFMTGHEEHALTSPDQGGCSQLKDLLETNHYRTQGLALLDRAQVPPNCSLLVVGGPRRDYIGAEIKLLQDYVEGGGGALFLLDPPLKIGPQESSENNALSDLLGRWGVTPDRDLILDESAASNSLGGGPTSTVVLQYASHEIVNNLANTATAFPFSRSLEIRETDRTSIFKLFSSSADSYVTHTLSSAEIRIDPAKDRRGPFTLAVAATYDQGAVQGRFIVVGNSAWVSNQALGFSGNRSLLLNMIHWLTGEEPH